MTANELTLNEHDLELISKYIVQPAIQTLAASDAALEKRLTRVESFVEKFTWIVIGLAVTAAFNVIAIGLHISMR